jgi:hypothetical protein
MPIDHLSVMAYVWLAIAAAVVGFGWSFGCWVFAFLSRDRRVPQH